MTSFRPPFYSDLKPFCISRNREITEISGIQKLFQLVVQCVRTTYVQELSIAKYGSYLLHDRVVCIFLQCSVPFVYPRRNRNQVAWSFSIPTLESKECRNGTLQTSAQPLKFRRRWVMLQTFLLLLPWVLHEYE